LFCLSLLGLGALPLRATLVWSADFESYNTTGGPVTATVNSTGDDDTFSDVDATASLEGSLVYQVQGTGLPSGMTGNALRLSITNTTGAGISGTSMRLFQYNQASLGSSGAFVLSYDIFQAGGSAGISSVSGFASTSSGSRSGSGTNASFTADMSAMVVRYTMVINRTGASITLPGSLGTLATDSTASYFYNGTTYGGLNVQSGVTSNSITGFSAGDNRSGTLNNNATLAAFYDNMGLWNSVTDTVNGVSVLSLAPGAAVPEPGSLTLVLLAWPLLAHRRRSARAKS
jgi:hypothetical protein